MCVFECVRACARALACVYMREFQCMCMCVMCACVKCACVFDMCVYVQVCLTDECICISTHALYVCQHSCVSYVCVCEDFMRMLSSHYLLRALRISALSFRLFQNILCSVCAVCAHELEMSNRIHFTNIRQYSPVSNAHVGEDVVAT